MTEPIPPQQPKQPPGQPEYSRLQGRPYRLVSVAGEYNEMWMAQDHVLCVQGNLVEERYRRIRFADVLAITVKPSNYRFNANLVLLTTLGVITLIFALVLFSFRFDPYMTTGWTSYILVIWAIVMLPGLILLFRNTMLGPTCTCRIHTDIQSLELPSLHRLRDANVVVSFITSAIERAQGTILSESSQEEITLEAARQRTLDQTPAPVRRPTMEGTSRLSWHQAVFSCCLIYAGLLTLVGFPFAEVHFLWVLEALLQLGLILVAIGAVLHQRNWKTPPIVRTLTWMVLVYTVGAALLVYGFGAAFPYFSLAFLTDTATMASLLPRADLMPLFLRIPLVVIPLALGMAGLIVIFTLRNPTQPSRPAESTDEEAS